MDNEKIMGKYATLRERFLKEYAPDMYEQMKEDGTLAEHLEYVQDMVVDYVNRAVEKLKRDEACYKEAEASGDFNKMTGYINNEILIAENDAGRMWIYQLPEEYDDEDEEDDVEYYDEDDDSYDYYDEDDDE